MPYHFASFYRFTPVADPAALRAPLWAACQAAGLRGSVLLAPEGVNGMLAGSAAGIAAVFDFLRTQPGLQDLSYQASDASSMPFARLKVRLKREIVGLGKPEVDGRDTGHFVSAADWNELISDPGTLLLDTRNDFEFRAGHFRGAVDPETRAFSEFPAYVERALSPSQKIAMYCTGGIRCEKASAYLKTLGFDEVYQLKGGILKYLEQVPATESQWEGECFVFDQRVTLTHGLAEGASVSCHACGASVSREAQRDPRFEAGASCPACYDDYSEADRDRFRMRHAQWTAA